MAHSCCNPFDIPGHGWGSRRKNLRSVTPWMCEIAPQISIGSKICDTCRKRLSKESVLIPDPETHISDSEHEADDADSEPYVEAQQAVSSLNKCLVDLGESPYSQIKARGKKYSKQKVQKITEAMKRTVISGAASDDGSEMIQQLKEKFQTTTQRSEQLQILTVLPKSWSLKKIEQEFNVSNYMARKSKELVKEKGVLSLPDPKPGPSLSPETVDKVRAFYESDDISRVMPGKKDFVSVKIEGKRVHVQKRLVLSNLKEVYHEFKGTFPDQKVGFSKFSDLRPKHCVLAGGSGTHSVCVCTIHQNVKLMMFELQLSGLPTYHHCLARIMCNPPLPMCYLGECDVCPGTIKLREELISLLDESGVDRIIYKQWVSTDRSTLETFCAPTEEFVETFCEKLELLRPHSFVASQQASFYTQCKANLQVGEMLVTADFSENYSFILQDAAQGFHWNNSQATLHPFVAYFIDSGEVRHLSYVIISDCLHHDTTAVHLFQKSFITFLKSFLPSESQPNKIVYFSDGAASQYKNRKNFLNLCHHKEDFGISAEWHFSATSHGKGACDGLGGTVKRLAARASLQRPYNDQIMTPRQLFDWACTNVPAVHFGNCSMEDYERERDNLEQRFALSRTIPGTRKLHSFIPISNRKVAVRFYSASDTFREEKVTVGKNDLPLESISGFVTCLRDRNWWLACVLEVIQEDSLVKLTFLHPRGPSSSFKYPQTEDIRTLPIDNILTLVDPRSRTGRVYSLSKKEVTSASKAFDLCQRSK